MSEPISPARDNRVGTSVPAWTVPFLDLYQFPKDTEDIVEFMKAWMSKLFMTCSSSAVRVRTHDETAELIFSETKSDILPAKGTPERNSDMPTDDLKSFRIFAPCSTTGGASRSSDPFEVGGNNTDGAFACAEILRDVEIISWDSGHHYNLKMRGIDTAQYHGFIPRIQCDVWVPTCMYNMRMVDH